MNPTTRKSWKGNLYLDALGSLSVIAASVLIFVSIAVTADTESVPSNKQLVDACPTVRLAAADYTDHRPGAPSVPAGIACA